MLAQKLDISVLDPFRADPEDPSCGWFTPEACDTTGLINCYTEDLETPEPDELIGVKEFYPCDLRAGQDSFHIPAVVEYANLLLAGSVPPVITVVVISDDFWGDEYIICDGHHRAMAAALAGTTVRAEVYSNYKQYWEG